MHDVVEEGVRKYLKFLKEVLRQPAEPEWLTTNSVPYHSERVYLRNFSVGDDLPTLILPPQAGHHSNIADYGPGQSLVEAALKSGRKSVYAVEWRAPSFERRHETIDTYIEETDNCVEKIGGRVNLIGLCQGGWQAAIYASLYPDKVENLVIAAAPIDLKAGGGKIQRYAEMLPMGFYESMVMAGGGNMPGEMMVFGFKMLDPVARFYGDYLEIYNNIDNEAYMRRNKRFRAWYEWTQDLPGAFYLQAVEELFKGNKLIMGEMVVDGKVVDLENIECPLFLIAGEKDEITLPVQVFNMEDYVRSGKIEKVMVPAGHIGVFMGSKVVKDYWPDVFSKF